MEAHLYQVHKECLDKYMEERDLLAAENRQLKIQLVQANTTIDMLRKSLVANGVIE